MTRASTPAPGKTRAPAAPPSDPGAARPVDQPGTPGTPRRRATRKAGGVVRGGATPGPGLTSDEDIDAQQHEVHGMIEDAMEPARERAGTDIQRE